MASSLLEADALALGGCPPSAQAFLLTDDLPSPLGGAHKPAAAAAGQAHAGGMGSGGGAAAGPPLLAPSYAAHGSGLVPVGLAATPQLGLHGGMGLHGQQQQHQQQQHLLQQPWSGTAGSSFASDAPALTTFTNNPPSSGYLPHPYHPQLPLSQPMLPQPSQQQQYSYLQQQHHQQQQFYAQHHHHHQQQQLFLQQSQCFPYQTQQPYPAAMQQHHPQMPLQPQGLPQPSFPAHHQHLQQLQAHAQAPDRYSAQASGGSASSGASERRLYSLVRVDAATGALLREATEDDAREAARLIESDSSCSAIPGGGAPLPRALSFVDGGGGGAAAAALEGSSGVGGGEQRAAQAAAAARGGASKVERRQDASGGGGGGGGGSAAARQKPDQAGRPPAEKRTGPCCHCGAVESPQWRKGPASKPVLCNACGTRFRRTHQLGPPIPSAARAAAAAAAPKRKAPAAGGGASKKAARGGS